MSLLDEFDKSVESFISYGKLYDDDTIKKGLSILPYVKQEAGEKAIKLKYQAKKAENNTKKIKSKLAQEAVRLKNAKNLTSVTDRNSWVELQPEYQEALEKELQAKEEWELSELKAKRYEDNLNVFQKLMTERINSNYLIDRSQKYIG